MKLADWLSTTKTKHEAFAEMIRVRQPSVSRYANGTRIPRPAVMQRIHEVTGGQVTPLDFFATSQ